MGSDVTSRRVPSEIGDTVVLASAKKLDVRSLLGFTSVRVIVGDKVKVPELDVALGRRGEGGEGNVTTLGRPSDVVGQLALEMLDRGEVALLRVGLEKVDVELDHCSRDVLAVVDVVGRQHGESVSMRLPSELRDVV